MRAARLYYACAGAIILHSAKWYVFENLFCSAGHSCRWGRGVSGLKIRTDPCGTPVKISLTKDIFLHGQTFFFSQDMIANIYCVRPLMSSSQVFLAGYSDWIKGFLRSTKTLTQYFPLSSYVCIIFIFSWWQ